MSLRLPVLLRFTDHIVQGVPFLPAAAMLELAAATAALLNSAADGNLLLAVTNMAFTQPVMMPSPTVTTGNPINDLDVCCSMDLTTGRLQLGHMHHVQGAVEQQPGRYSMSVCAVGSATVVAAPSGRRTPDQQHAAGLQQAVSPHHDGPVRPAAVSLLAGIVASHIAQASMFDASSPASSAVTGSIAPVDVDWTSSGYITSQRQVDAALHLGVVPPGSGAKIPISLRAFMVPTVAAAESQSVTMGCLYAAAAAADADAAVPHTVRRGSVWGRMSYLLTAVDAHGKQAAAFSPVSLVSEAAESVATGRLVVVVEGLQTKVMTATDVTAWVAQQWSAPLSSTPAATTFVEAGATSSAEKAEDKAKPAEDTTECMYETVWQLSEPMLVDGRMQGDGGQLQSSARLSLRISPHAPNTLADVRIELGHEGQPGMVTAAALAELQCASTALAVQAELPDGMGVLGPTLGNANMISHHGRDASSALWGLLRTHASEHPGMATHVVDGTLTSSLPLAVSASTGIMDACALRSGAVAVPRLVPSTTFVSADYISITPEPRSALSNLVARPVDISKVCMRLRTALGRAASLRGNQCS